MSSNIKEVALITGGTDGIGKAQVYRWVKEGFEVIFCGRNVERGNQVATETKSHFIKCDVSDPDQVEKMFIEIRERYHRLDVLFNNAGIAPKVPARLADIPNENYRQILSVNLDGMWYVLKHAIKLMVEGGKGGRIVNMGSVTGITGCASMIGATHYGTSKSAIVGLTQTAAMEYIPEKIRINSVAPAAIETDMIRKYFLEAPLEMREQMTAVLTATNPMINTIKELPKESDVTGVVSFLVGPDAKFINGQTIAIDGGYSIH